MTRPLYYSLDGKTVVPASNVRGEFESLMEDHNRRWVGLDHIVNYLGQHYMISTVFLVINHQFIPEKPPLVFETMVFADFGWSEEYCDRYSTWEEAEKGHQRAIWLFEHGREATRHDEV